MKNKLILSQYKELIQDFNQLSGIVYGLLGKLIVDNNFYTNCVQCRVKEFESLKNKLHRKGDAYNDIYDITDILGSRIVCYYTDDVYKIGKVIEENFVVDWENSLDKSQTIKTDSFGYLSLHYIISLDQAKYNSNLCKIRFELQIRTMLQHTWSDVNHHIGYKGDFGMPREVARSFARVAGLLEIADAEFIRIRDLLTEFTTITRNKIVNDDAEDVILNEISLKYYLDHNPKMKAFLQSLAEIEGSEIYETSCDQYLSLFEWLGINTIGGLQDMLNRNSELAYKLAYQVLNGTELYILASNVAFRYLCRAELINKGYSNEKIIEFFNLTANNLDKATKQATLLLKSYEKILGEK